MAALAMVSMNALADTTITWTASEQGYGNGEKLTDVTINLDNVVTATFGKGSGSSEPAYYNTGTAARLYGGNTLTIATLDESSISEIKMTYTVNKVTDDKFAASNGEFTAADGTATWTGSETSVQFSNTNTSGHFRIATITVTYGGGTGVTKTSTSVTIDATGLTNTDLANGTAAGKLVATVAAGDNTLSDAVVAWTSDNEQVATIAEDGTVTLVAAGEAKLKAEYAGDDNYYGSSATYTLTVENSAYQTVGQGTLENPFTASDAIWLANNGEYVDEECYIKGIVFKVNTTDANITSYGNIDYYISEDGQEKTPSFEVFRGYYFDGAKFTVDTKVLVGDEVVVKGMLKMYNDQAETAQGAVLVKLVRDGQEVTPVEVVNAPTISGEATFEETVTVTITAEEGCTIYYTLDGNDPTTESTQYTEPFTLTETTTVKAIAAKGETVSEVATATFTKTEPTPEDGIVFDFNADYTTLFGIDEVTSQENVYNFETSTNSATVEGVFVTVSAAEEGVSTPNRIWNSDPRLRLYSGYIMFTSQTNKIEKIVLTRTTNNGLVANQNTADSGELTTSDQKNNAEVMWTGQAGSVKITIAGNTQFSKAVVYLGDVPTGITNVTANANANVLYNMAGQRVAKGYKGLVIVEGKKMLVK